MPNAKGEAEFSGSLFGRARSPSAPGLCWDVRCVYARLVFFVVGRSLPDQRARRARPTKMRTTKISLLLRNQWD